MAIKSVFVLMLVALTVGLALTAGSSLQAVEWGTLKGRFLYDGKAPEPKPINVDMDKAFCGNKNLMDEQLVVGSDGGLANVVVLLRTKNVAVHTDYEKTANDKVVLKMENCRFEPHILLLRTSQTLVLENADPMACNCNALLFNSPAFNPLIPAGDSLVIGKLEKEEQLGLRWNLSSNVHQWMRGLLVVRDNPYMAISDSKGVFTIKNLPPGTELEFSMWQEQSGYLKGVMVKEDKTDSKGRFKIKLAAAETDLGDIKVPPSLFEKQTPDHMEHNEMMQTFAKACSDCQRACDSCARHCSHMLAEGKKEYQTTLATCQGCATVCSAAAQVVARGGPDSNTFFSAFAETCSLCGKECEKFPDDKHMKACAEECRKCEKACREMVKHYAIKNLSK